MEPVMIELSVGHHASCHLLGPKTAGMDRQPAAGVDAARTPEGDRPTSNGVTARVELAEQ